MSTMVTAIEGFRIKRSFMHHNRSRLPISRKASNFLHGNKKRDVVVQEIPRKDATLLRTFLQGLSAG